MSKMFEKSPGFKKNKNALSEAAHRAATRLSLFLDSPVKIEYLGIRKGNLAEIFVDSRKLYEEVVGAAFASGKIKMYLLIAFTPLNAKKIVELCYKDSSEKPSDHGKGHFDEREQSVITEVGNLLAGAFFSGLSDALEKDIEFGAPGFVEDLLGAVLDGFCGEAGMESPLLSNVEVKIKCQDINLSGTIYMVGV